MDVQDNNEQRRIETIREFFQDCKEKGLLRDTRYDQEELKKTAARAGVFHMTDKATEEINDYMNDKENNYQKFLSDKEHSTLQFSRQVHFSRDYTEELKILLHSIFDPCIIEAKNQLGVYFKQIYDKLEYCDKKRQPINKAFQIDLRNALSHQDYCYDIGENGINSITWNGYDKQYTWKFKEFCEMNQRIIAIIGEISNIINKLTTDSGCLESDQRNGNELKEHEETIKKFFDDCKELELLTCIEDKSDEWTKARTRIKASEITRSALEKIRCYRNAQKDNSQKILLSDKMHDALQFSFHINLVRESIEETGILLPLIFDRSKTPLHGSLEKNLDTICTKLKYDEKEICRINKAFQVDLRHALTHQNYRFDIGEYSMNMTWQDSNGMYRWTPHDLLKSNTKACFIIMEASKSSSVDQHCETEKL